MTFADFIDQKGVKAMALALGVPYQTVWAWRRRGIPAKRWEQLKSVYCLTQAQVFAMVQATASTPSRQAA
jgi:hypothetical protein